MKRNILAGSFQCESNSFVPRRGHVDDFEIRRGQDCLEALVGARRLAEAGASVQPLLYASALPTGVVAKETFDYFCGAFCEEAAKHPGADGLYLYLHGSMLVEGIGSGELGFIKRLREVTGPIPISLALDFHANLPAELVRIVQAVNGFRTAPHTDQNETETRAANALLALLDARKLPRVASVHVPFLCADAAVTSKPPFIAVNERLRQLDGTDGIVSAAFFHGHAWNDADYAGCRAVVSSFWDDAFEHACIIAKLFWDAKDSLTLDNAMLPEQAIEAALSYRGRLLVVSDSGDNTTAGAEGRGTLLLQALINRGATKTLVCGIFDKQNTDRLLGCDIGSTHDITLCPGGASPQEQELKLEVLLAAKGSVCGWVGGDVGEGVLLRCGGVDIILTNVRAAFTSPAHFRMMTVNPNEYRVIVLKMGYLFPLIDQMAADAAFALTPGQSSNDFSSLPYRNLHAGMYPITNSVNWGDIALRAKAENDIEEGMTCIGVAK